MVEEKKKIDQNYNRKYNDEFTKKKIHSFSQRVGLLSYPGALTGL